jgi:hypothetical protein
MSSPSDPSSPSFPEPNVPGPSRAKARILMPIAISVAALAVFLVAFWPDGPRGKKSHADRGRSTGHGAGRYDSPVGGSDRGELEDLGNTSVTKGGGPSRSGSTGSSPVGGSPVGGGSREDGASRDKGEQWWYEDGKGASKAKSESGERGRNRDSKDSKGSGPDEGWWHD